MTYRPQFAFPAPPPGYRDEQFHYSYDGTNCALLANPIAAGALTGSIILLTEADAPFIARALKIQLGTAISPLWFQLVTPRGDYMQSVPVPLALYAGNIDGLPIAGQYFVPFDSEIECPAGSNFTLFLYNPTGGSVDAPEVTLYGVKRRKPMARRAA
jgi:hypothetical protein